MPNRRRNKPKPQTKMGQNKADSDATSSARSPIKVEPRNASTDRYAKSMEARIFRLQARRKHFNTQCTLGLQRSDCNVNGLLNMVRELGGEKECAKLEASASSLQVPHVGTFIPQTLEELEAEEKEITRLEQVYRTWKIHGTMMENQCLIWEAQTVEEKEKRAWEAFAFVKEAGLYVGKEPTEIEEVLGIMFYLYNKHDVL
ncbi:hypothetical protein BJ508DRAFT_315999 [Ascobolus immersus RN42]|uniref:Uncharacterized protein n=1 Tax=Ascobolus immersus RN42 TaxID=1160509 RepID=A0A3N4HB02_ASCIM|nr:hypothetical protein BJ508DRAFT_315999 [Ascobolus immersus RN42]